MSGGIDQGWLSAGVSWLLNADPDTSPYRNVKDIVLFVGAALALYFTFRRMKAAEEQNKNQTKAIEAQTAQIELSRRDQLSKRFTEAVKQLGDGKLEIRMGGIAGLWAVATESTHPEDRIMVLDVLCAFVRNSPHPKEDEPQTVRPDVKFAMDRLGSEGPYFPWGDVEEGHQPYRRDFSGAYLVEWNSDRGDYRFSKFIKSNIESCEFTCTDFSDSIFFNSSLLVSNFLDCNLAHSQFHGINCISIDGSDITGGVFLRNKEISLFSPYYQNGEEPIGLTKDQMKSVFSRSSPTP